MPNPVYNQAFDAVSNFVGLSGDRRDLVYDDYLDPASPRMNKALEERGFIEFRYGGGQTGFGLDSLFAFDDNPFDDSREIAQTRKLPFFEDPTIKVTGTSNYAENKILMRNEPVRLYTGTDARKFSIDLIYTLPHVVAMLRTYDTKDVKDDIEVTRLKMVETIREDFKLTEFQVQNTIRTADDTPIGTIVESDRKEGPRLPVNRTLNLGESLMDNYLYKVASNPESYGQSDLYAYIGHLMNIVETSIRSSVGGGFSNAAKYGPPIALLKYGAVHDFVPCIVKGYKIEYRSDSGNDNGSLYPRVIRVKLDLEEFRQTNGIIHGEGNDDVWGWDSVFRNGTIPKWRFKA